MDRVHFLDLPIAIPSREEAVTAVLAAAETGGETFRLVNAGTLHAAYHDRTYWALLQGQGTNLPDGGPLATVLSRRNEIGRAVRQVRGPWLFEECLRSSSGMPIRHFLLGSSPETLEVLQVAIRRRFPSTDVVGSYSPPFGARAADELRRQDEIVVASGANLVWVAMGTPRQDAEALRITQETGVTTIAVGAAFDFTAETKRSAPAWVSRIHLEWVHRLLSEPRRLWRRYLFGNSRFLLLSARHLARRA